MMPRRVHWLSLIVALGLAAPSADAQFNPQGRSKKAKPGKAKPKAGPAPRASGTAPRPAVEAPTKAPDPAKTPSPAAKGPTKEVLMARYMSALLAQPGADFPLERLAELYRERDGNLNALVADLEARASGSGPERYAALLALAGLHKIEGRFDQALAAYERASALDPQNPASDLAVARLLEQRGDKAGARARYEKALGRISVAAERETVLRTLLTLSLDLSDFDGAKRFHKELVRAAGSSFFTRAELGRELLTRGQYDRAVDEMREVVKAAAGDNRVLAPALRDLGRALARAGRRQEALVELDRAMRAAGTVSGIRREVYETVAEVYRAEDRLPELIVKLERSPAQDPDELRLLAALYEESGRIEDALKVHRKVLGREAGDIATRLKVVSLLEAQGALDQAIVEYESLIRAAPRNPDYVFRLAEALIQRGERKKALDQLSRLEARAAADDEVLPALVDFYERVGEKDKSFALLQRLAASNGSDPEHLVELGTRYWMSGDKKRAVQTWQRIRAVAGGRAEGLLILGEVYLEHDLLKEALEALSEATKLEPKQERFKKAYALGLERAGAGASSRDTRRLYHDEALQIWTELLRERPNDAAVAREARQHIVTLWSLGGQLPQRAEGLRKRFNGTPPDLDAGRLLAEAEVRMRRHADAEATLRRVSELAPGDLESLTRLERVLVVERKLSDAIVVLERLSKLEPKRAREYYQRMAEYSAELYRDDDAVRYAARAVELSPDDAEGHEKLGRMYRRRQEPGKAISELRQAISKNERAFPVYLELSELLLGQGELDEADRLLRRVVRACPDEDLVARAARISVQLNLGRGTLESLERELLPVALGNPDRPVYRRLLVEIYGALAYPLLHRARTGTPEDASEARATLARIGERAVKPLLDALSDDRASQQQVAITLLTHVENRSAGPALVAYATGEGEPELRARAMIAAGALRDAALLPRFRAVLMPKGTLEGNDSDPVTVAAAWGVARMGSRAARPILNALAASDAPNLGALGALGLGLLRDPSAIEQLLVIARAPQSGNLRRAAAAQALAWLGAKREAETLAQLAQAPDTTLRTSAVLALSRLGAEDAKTVIADALVDSDPGLRRAAAAAAAAWATGDYRAPADPLPPPSGKLDVREALSAALPGPYTEKERETAIERLAPELSRAGRARTLSSPERAEAVLEALGLGPGATPVPALTVGFSDAALGRARRTVTTLAAALVPGFAALARHPDPRVRTMAIGFLGTRAEAEARLALGFGLQDSDPGVRRAALAAAPVGDEAAAGTIAGLLETEPNWALRAAAAEALGRIGEKTKPPEKVLENLRNAALRDDYALVRQAAAKALHALGRDAAREVLDTLYRTDPEPRVKQTAWELLHAR
jgi:tetratricopeptide (TPR) repeat protein/HEAT repeat protein